MADFPSSPTIGATFSGSDGTDWVWDGYSWVGTMSSGSQAKVGEIQQIYSSQELYTQGTKEFLKSGSIVLAENYPDFPETSITKADYLEHFGYLTSTPGIGTGASYTGLIDTDNDGVWVLCHGSTREIYRSEDNGTTWKLVFVLQMPQLGLSAWSFYSMSTNLLGDWILSGFSGNACGYLRSTDNGKTWQLHIPPASFGISAGGKNFNWIKFQPYTRYCVAVNDVGAFQSQVYWFTSNDAGLTWNQGPAASVADFGAQGGHGPREDGHWWFFYKDASSRTCHYLVKFTDLLNAPTTTFDILNYQTAFTNVTVETTLPNQYGDCGNAAFSVLMSSGIQLQSNNSNYNVLNAYSPGQFPSGYNKHVADIYNNKVIYAFDGASTSYVISYNSGVTWSSAKSTGFVALASFNKFRFGKDNVAIALTGGVGGSAYYLGLPSEMFITRNAYDATPTWERLILSCNNAVTVNSQTSLVFSNTGLYLVSPYQNTVYNRISTTATYRVGASNERGNTIVVSSQVAGNLQYYTGGAFTTVTNLAFNATNYAFRDPRLYEYDSGNSSPTLTDDSAPASVFFRPDGTEMYVVGNITKNVIQYNISTAWNLSTATREQSYNVNTQETSPKYVAFKPDGTKMLVIGSTNRTVYSYVLSQAWNVATASYESKSYNAGAAPGNTLTLGGFYINSNGTKFWITDTADNPPTINEYGCSTAWDVSTTTFRGKTTFLQGLAGLVPRGIYIPESEDKIFTTAQATDLVYEWILDKPGIIGTSVWNRRIAALSPETAGETINFSSNGHMMFTVGTSADRVYAYSLFGSPTNKVYSESIPNDIKFSNGKFYAAMSNGIITTSNDGINWRVAHINNTGKDYIRIVPQNNGSILAFSDSTITKSDNFGTSFVEINNPDYKSVYAVVDVDTDNSGTMLAIDKFGFIKRSVDYGNTWIGLDYTITEWNYRNTSPRQILSIGSNTWAVLLTTDSNSKIFISKNDGETWFENITYHSNANSIIKMTYSKDKKELYLYSNSAAKGIQKIKSTINFNSSDASNYLRIK